MSSLKIIFLIGFCAIVGVGVVVVLNDHAFDREVEKVRQEVGCLRPNYVAVVFAPWPSTRESIVLVAFGGNEVREAPAVTTRDSGGVYSVALEHKVFERRLGSVPNCH